MLGFKEETIVIDTMIDSPEKERAGHQLVVQLYRICLQCRRPQFNSWIRKIPWRKDRLPTPVFTNFPSGSDGKESTCKKKKKESTCNAGDVGSIPGLGRSSGRGHGNPLQYSCLENPHRQKSLAGYSPWGCRVRHDWMTKHSTEQTSGISGSIQSKTLWLTNNFGWCPLYLGFCRPHLWFRNNDQIQPTCANESGLPNTEQMPGWALEMWDERHCINEETLMGTSWAPVSVFCPEASCHTVANLEGTARQRKQIYKIGGFFLKGMFIFAWIWDHSSCGCLLHPQDFCTS